MAEPISIAEARSFCRIIGPEEDLLLEQLIAAARAMVEHETGRALVPSVLDLYLEDFPARRTWAEIPAPPARELLEITYRDPAGETHTLDLDTVHFDTRRQPARLLLEPGATWPATDRTAGAVHIRCTAGYSDPSLMPQGLRTAVLWIVAWWFEQRLPVAFGPAAQNLPDHYRSLLAAHGTTTIHPEEIYAWSLTPIDTGPAAMRLFNHPAITTLTGGGPTALDGLSTHIYQAGDIVVLSIDGASAQWQLRARGEGEDEDGAAYVISDDATTLIWVRIA